MKVLISVDIEGVACVVHPDDGKLEGEEYQRARRWMTAEANAAIAGAKDAGAKSIVVADAHGQMRNLLAEELIEEEIVQIVRGSPRPLGMVNGVDEDCAAALFIGYHAMEGTANGVLAHSYSGRSIQEMRLNGKPVGEMGFNAAICGAFGVPVIFVSGDDRLAAEAAQQLPLAQTVITKWGVGAYAARNLHPRESCRQIRAGVEDALERLPQLARSPSESRRLLFQFKQGQPIRYEVIYKRSSYGDHVAHIPGLQRLAGNHVAYESEDFLELASIKNLLVYLPSSL